MSTPNSEQGFTNKNDCLFVALWARGIFHYLSLCGADSLKAEPPGYSEVLLWTRLIVRFLAINTNGLELV